MNRFFFSVLSLGLALALVVGCGESTRVIETEVNSEDQQLADQTAQEYDSEDYQNSFNAQQNEQ